MLLFVLRKPGFLSCPFLFDVMVILDIAIFVIINSPKIVLIQSFSSSVFSIYVFTSTMLIMYSIVMELNFSLPQMAQVYFLSVQASNWPACLYTYP